ncbi:MAG: elongation factor G [Deltaproteobacteria bacterium]|nr:elongation factor G [Deltaproteobacteria bacterium]
MTRSIPITRMRNFGIVAHVDAGKTTLTERLLFFTRAIHKKGEVHHGNTTTDSHPLERARGITIASAAVSCAWREHVLQLIDTPGHVDFAIEVERCLRVLDGAVVVLDAVAGVEPQTEGVWRRADRHRLPRLVFVNKLDRAGADFDRCVAELRDRLGAVPLVILLPWLRAKDGVDEAVGVVDVMRGVALRWVGGSMLTEPVPAELETATSAALAALVTALSDDDGVMAAVVEDRRVDESTLRRALRAATLSGAVVPVLCGAALADVGVEPLLDAIVDLLPSPLDRGSVAGIAPVDDVDVVALAFKVLHDDYGATTLVRVYAGTLAKGASVVSMRSGKKLRIGRLARVFAGKFVDVEAAVAGDIVGVIGVALATGDTLCASGSQMIALESIEVPVPVMSVAIEPQSREARDALGIAVSRLVAEDPSLVVRTDDETGQTTLSGQGELHLEVALLKLRDDHHVDVRASQPRVAFKETLGGVVEHELVWKKQSGGPGQWAKVKLRIAAGERGAGFVFSDVIKGGAVPAQFIAAVKDGVCEALGKGVRWGFPVVDVDVVLLDGAIHDRDSSELAFHLAGRQCFAEAAPRALPRLLEPVMNVDVTVSEDRLGDVVGDLTRRRGLVRGVDGDGATRVVRAAVPLMALFGYAGALRSLTQGRGTFTQTLSGLAVVPENVAATVKAT